jgi:hypothetical protein
MEEVAALFKGNNINALQTPLEDASESSYSSYSSITSKPIVIENIETENPPQEDAPAESATGILHKYLSSQEEACLVKQIGREAHLTAIATNLAQAKLTKQQSLRIEPQILTAAKCSDKKYRETVSQEWKIAVERAYKQSTTTHKKRIVLSDEDILRPI